jgi:hypothetical protein
VNTGRKPLRLGSRAGQGKSRPKRNRGGWYAALVLSAGASSALAASFGLWPFAALHLVATNAIHHVGVSSPIQARAIFPPVGPLHKALDVYDLTPPPPPAAVPGGQPDPGPGNFPVINFPAGPLSAIEAACEAAKQAAENQSEAYKQSVELQCEAAKQAYERAHP